MNEIKSALQIALERVKGLETPSDQEKLRWKYQPEGEKLGVRFLKDENVNLVYEISQFEDKGRKYVSAAAVQLLVRKLALPKDENIKKSNKRVMDGIKELKTDKVAVENVFSKMRRILTHFSEDGERQKKQAYETLKREMDVKLQQAAQQQLKFTQAKVPVENTPEFQVEWHKLQARLEQPYRQYLEDFKQQLLEIK